MASNLDLWESVEKTDIEEILSRLRRGDKRKLIAADKQVSVVTVAMIARNEIWKEVPRG